MQELRRLRQERGLYQRELAQMVGIGRTGIGMLETGDYNPSLPLLIRLADALEVSLDTLVNRNANARP